MSRLQGGAVAEASLFSDDEAPTDCRPELGLTFRDSKSQPIHGWYPYVEGFSAQYIQGLMRSQDSSGIVYDPFGGSGTLNLIAAHEGISSAFSEANPFMRFVAETKVNARQLAIQNWADFEKILGRIRHWMISDEFEYAATRQDLEHYGEAFKGRDFFDPNDLCKLLAIKDAIQFFSQEKSAAQDLLLLALASITVSCSRMTRRADLRYRRANEYRGRVVDVRKSYLDKLAQIERDMRVPQPAFAPTKFVSADSREEVRDLIGKVSLVLTSPPYLNGTNYIRNTKLEL